MADEGVQRLLRDLKLEDVIPVFQKNKITMNVLPMLTDKQIKKLVPLIGEQAIFLKYWRENITQSSQQKSCSNKRVRNDCDNNEVDVVLEVIQPEKKVKYLAAYEEVVATLNSMALSSLSIRDIICQSTNGKKFLSICDSLPVDNLILNDSQRNMICTSICEECGKRGIFMDNATAYEAAKMIVKVFPSEVISTYFLPPIKKCNSTTGKSEPSRGKLLTKWRNMKTRNKKLEAELGRIFPKVIYKIEEQRETRT